MTSSHEDMSRGEPTDVGPLVGGDAPATQADIVAVVQSLDGARDAGVLSAHEHDHRARQARKAAIVDDLTVLTRDLPAQTTQAPWPQAATTIPAAGAETSLVAVLGDIRREGHWTVGEHTRIWSALGDVTLDLTRASFDGQHVEFAVMSVLGDVTVRVPEGVQVIDTTHKILGDTVVKVDQQPQPGAPAVRITGITILGDVKVTGPKLSRRERRRRRLPRRRLA